MAEHTKRRTGIIESLDELFYKIEIDGVVNDVPRNRVDSSAKVNDIVEWDGERWRPNHEKTSKRSQDILQLMDDVWEDI